MNSCELCIPDKKNLKQFQSREFATISGIFPFPGLHVTYIQISKFTFEKNHAAFSKCTSLMLDAWPEAIILGDINMVLDRRKDMLPPESQRGNDHTAAHTAYRTFLQTVTRHTRVYDAYRYLHPQEKSMTREAGSMKGGKRLDTINLTEGFMMHTGRLHDVRHTPLDNLGIAREGSKTPKMGDHREVRATMKIADEPKPKPTWKQNMGVNHPHLESQMAAEHAMRILRLIQDPTHRPYKNCIRYQMKNHYGAVNATDTLICNYQ